MFLNVSSLLVLVVSDGVAGFPVVVIVSVAVVGGVDAAGGVVAVALVVAVAIDLLLLLVDFYAYTRDLLKVSLFLLL